MFCIFKKIKACRMALVAWAQNTFGNSKTKLRDKHRALEVLVSQNDPNNIGDIKKLKGEIKELLFQDELFWRQQSRSIWLPAGDKSTRFFHQRAS